MESNEQQYVIVLDDATVERAAEALGSLYEPWEESPDNMPEIWRSDVRAVLAAAVKAGQ